MCASIFNGGVLLVAASYFYPTCILRVSYDYPTTILRVSYVYPMYTLCVW